MTWGQLVFFVRRSLMQLTVEWQQLNPFYLLEAVDLMFCTLFQTMHVFLSRTHVLDTQISILYTNQLLEEIKLIG